jgi:acetyl-CoA carboxylase biotin carboxyl carrier protein
VASYGGRLIVDINLDELIALVELLKNTEFSEFKYEKGDLRVVIRRNGHADEQESKRRAEFGDSGRVANRSLDTKESKKQATDQASPYSSSTVDLPPGAAPVNSPLLGTFYTRPKPGEPPFVSVGTPVDADTVLCIIEVMKLMNSVVAGVRGVVIAIHANEGDLVEHNQLLFSIAPLNE